MNAVGIGLKLARNQPCRFRDSTCIPCAQVVVDDHLVAASHKIVCYYAADVSRSTWNQKSQLEGSTHQAKLVHPGQGRKRKSRIDTGGIP